MSGEVEDEEYFLLQDQRVFGAGIKRKRVLFVRAESEPAHASQSTTTRKPGLGDRYLSIVLPQITNSTSNQAELSAAAQKAEKPPTSNETTICPVCKLPITPSASTSPAQSTKSHESSLAHQVCLTHSHPPFPLSRSHIGLKYLSSYGWDPDARRGLGATGSGIRVPIKGKVKNNTVGLGVKDSEGVRVQKEAKEKRKVRLNNAKQVREQVAVEKERERRLRDAFYGRDLEAYLGPGW